MATVFVVSMVTIWILTTNAFRLDDNQLVDYRLMVSKKEITPFLGKVDCSKENILVCQDCTSIGLCISDGNDGWDVIDGGKCGEGETCLRGSCTKDANPKCATNLNFICTSTGMFPNQEDCKRYHFCVRDSSSAFVAFDDVCTDNYGYHAQSTYCSKAMKTAECNYYPVPVCKKLGEIGPIKENQVLYYVCIRRAVPGGNLDVLYPVLHACEHGRHFDRYSNKCKSK